jgi:TonB-linked SusC/RagA family outer membrane protein
MYIFYNKKFVQPPRCINKILLIMKLTTLILIISIMQVSATGFAQRITLSEKGATMKKVFGKIKAQTGYDFIFYDASLTGLKPVSIQVTNEDLKVVLDKLFLGQPLEYSIEDKSVVVSKRETSFIETAKEKITTFFQGDSVTFKGRVYDGYGMPLPGASVKVKGTKKATFTTKEGYFAIYAASDAVLQVSYIGYATQELQMRREDGGNLIKFNMKPATENLGEVAIVSTGYQDLPKERATGSFQTITAKQLQHSTDPNLLKRLEGITTGLDFNNNNVNLGINSATAKVPKASPLTYLTIRGKNTLVPNSPDPNLLSGQVLVVIDGIASPYGIDKINPNDVESINILQDAAAASIWGSRAANGVIVVKTKRGNYNRPNNISFNSNFNITDKVDLFYRNSMSTSDFIDAELMQLNYNYNINPVILPDPTLTDIPQNRISPVAEIWTQWKKDNNTLEFNRQIDSLRRYDVRNDLSKYFFRKAIVQSYSLAVDGGTNKYAYRLSSAYDKTKNNTINSDDDRITLNYAASVKPLKQLEVNAAITYIQLNGKYQGAGAGAISGEDLYPYTRLMDDLGNPAAVPRTYRPGFVNLLNSTYGDKVLDMTWRPLYDIDQGYVKRKNQTLNLNLVTTYTINSIFSGQLIYNTAFTQNEQNQLRGQNSFFMREQINKFTDPVTFNRLIPLGGIYLTDFGKSRTQSLRGQLNVNKTWSEKHVLSAIAGFDGSEDYSDSRHTELYGYNEKTKQINNNLPFNTFFPLLYPDINTGNPQGRILYAPAFSDFRVRTFNFFSNAAYTYDKRYTLSASLRADFSSLLGKRTNSNGARYYSTGAAWNINNEPFYKVSWLPNLQVKASFGYGGNINSITNPVPVISYIPQSIGNNLPYASTFDGLNRELRPEKTGVVNLELNFGLKNNRISGSLAYYVRKTTDLIALNPLDPSSGFDLLSYNIANLRGHGLDASLNTLNLKLRDFSWNSSLLFSYNQVKVTKLYSSRLNTAQQLVSGTPAYNEGAELSRLYAYRWAGLDPETGDPMGYDANGNPIRITGDLSVLNQVYNAPASSVHYFGSSVPVYYGSFRNSFTYKSFSVSANFLYKLGYYFRRPVRDLVRYDVLLNSSLLQGAEYAQRWQKAGDEKFTNVPSLTFPVSPGGPMVNRDSFYYNSEINVLKGDHVRLQEINLSYSLKNIGGFIKSPRFYANISNLGIVWRANKRGIDPDIPDFPNPKTYSFGLSANF